MPSEVSPYSMNHTTHQQLRKQLFLGNLQGQLHTAHQITEMKQLKWHGRKYNAIDTPNDGSRENHNASNATETPHPAPKRRRNLIVHCICHSSLTHLMQEPNQSYNVMALTLSGLSIPDPWQWSNSPENDSPKKNAVSASVQLNNPTPLIVQEPRSNTKQDMAFAQQPILMPPPELFTQEHVST